MHRKERAQSGTLQRICGTISDIQCTRDVASFVFLEAEQTAIGVVAIAANLVGTLVQSDGTAATDMLEEADYVEFTLDDRPIKGWVWRSPFNNGDVVEVIADCQRDYFEAYAIARPADRIVALYPHCSRGWISHWLNAAKWWLLGSAFSVALLISMFLLHALFFSPSWAETQKYMADLVPASAAVLILLALVATVLLAKRWMSFVHLAELVFHEYGWQSPATVDLKKRSKKGRTNSDGAEYGVFFFRY